MAKIDLPLKPGDIVDYGTVQGGLSGGSCRVRTKTVERVDDDADRVYFTDGTTYHHNENKGMTLTLRKRTQVV